MNKDHGLVYRSLTGRKLHPQIIDLQVLYLPVRSAGEEEGGCNICDKGFIPGDIQREGRGLTIYFTFDLCPLH